MPVIGAVLTLSEGAVLPASFPADPRVSLGEREKDRLPFVLLTDSREEERALLENIRDLPGVLDLQIAFVDLSDLSEVSP